MHCQGDYCFVIKGNSITASLHQPEDALLLPSPAVFFFSLHKQYKHQDMCFSFSCCEQALCLWQKMHFEFSFVHNIKVCSVWNLNSSQWMDFAARWLHFSIYRLKHSWYWRWAVNFFRTINALHLIQKYIR